MKKKALLKSSLREIRQAPTRFLSIVGIIFLGVAFFVGIAATGPDMIAGIDHYFRKQQLADVTVVSSLGLVAKDEELLAADKEVAQVEAQAMADIHLSQLDKVLRFFSYQEDGILQYVVKAGRLPKNANEVALDELALIQGDFALGDTLEIQTVDDLPHAVKSHQLKVVGFVNSPEFIENLQRGQTTVGKGLVDYFALVASNQLDTSQYGRLLVRLKNTSGQAYSKEYQQQVTKGIHSIETTLKNRPQERLTEVKTQVNNQLAEVKKELETGEQSLDGGAKQLEDAQQKISTQKSELAKKQQSFAQEITAAKNQLKEAETSLQEQNKQLAKEKETLEKDTQTLAEDRQKAAELAPEIAEKTQLEKEISDNQNHLQQVATLVASLKQVISQGQTTPDKLKENLVIYRNAWSQLIGQLPDNAEIATGVDSLNGESSLEELQAFEKKVMAYQEKMTTGNQATEKQLAFIQEIVSAVDPAAISAKEAALKVAAEKLALKESQLTGQKKTLTTQTAALKNKETEGQKELDTAEAQLKTAEETYQKQLADYQVVTSESMPKLLDAQQLLKNQSRQLAALKPADYQILQRQTNPGYQEYHQNAQRISSLATVFPVIFFLIAALICLTSMSRMIDEKRGEIGTLKALGYKNSEIAIKYVFYSFFAGIIGSLAGLAVGFYLFPNIIIQAYGQLYNLPHFPTPWHLSYSLIALLVALICTVGITLLTLRMNLFTTAANLLRPKAPKGGRRVLLEKIKPLWHKLNFIQKVTIRNIFRYKSRMFMTILGIAGCTAMIVTGFGLRDSIGDMVPLQFNNLWQYQGVVTLDEKITEENSNAVAEILLDEPEFIAELPMYSEVFQVETPASQQEVTFYLPEKGEELAHFVNLRDPLTKEKLILSDSGSIIDEKLAQLAQVQVGDSLTLISATDQKMQIKIAGIAENYVGHFVYATPDYYESVFQKEPHYPSQFILFDEDFNKAQEEKLAEKLMATPGVVNVSFLRDSSDALADTIQVLTIVVWVLIISAGLLAFIVMYNLNTINIAERIRELSTIKVLGFYPKELTMYIFRENLLLCLLGIVLGWGLGFLEHRYVLQTVELDMIKFVPDIHWQSYLFASGITLFFTLIVGSMVHQKLKKVDMIAALKSNE